MTVVLCVAVVPVMCRRPDSLYHKPDDKTMNKLSIICKFWKNMLKFGFFYPLNHSNSDLKGRFVNKM